MKGTVFVGLCLLVGCGREHKRAGLPRAVGEVEERRVDEEPLEAVPIRELVFTPRPDPPAEITEEKSWPQRQAELAEQLNRLREYAAQAEPDDPFAMTEERIEELAKREDLVIE